MPGTNLTRTEATARSEIIEVASYHIELDLTDARDAAIFSSTTVVRFTASDPGASSFIDLVAPRVHEIVLNGVRLDPAEVFADSRITLPGLAAQNELRVVAECAYTTSGEGLHRFVDPVDGETYLYTQFEIPDARRVFASFEQPDLKSEFQFTVTAPAGWQVISNEIAPEPDAGPNPGTQLRRFAPTPAIPTYITALITGPYAGVHDVYEAKDGRQVPLGIYCRPSLARYLDPDSIFEVAKQGLAFFEEKFQINYPFSKLDFLFVPGFNTFGMENAGAVTIRDEDVFRSKVTERDYQERADTVLHELAHMWFGNLVTMRWWNDLWLNESFATFMSVLCQAEAPGSRWQQAWTTFADSMKTKAYAQDQLPSTHPIVAEINDLADVLVNLDGITYEKGASVLKQLVAYVGPDEFFAGVQAYMARHAWGNATLADLLVALERTSGRDLQRWSELWLQTAGINVLEPELTTAADGTVLSCAIRQRAEALPAEAAGRPVLRPHRIAAGCYDFVGGKLVRTERIELDLDGELTPVPGLVGRKRPAVLLINDDDLTYAKVRFDPESLATVSAHVGDFAATLPRALCWSTAWDLTRDGELATRDYLEMVLGGIGSESDIGVVLSCQRQLKCALDLYADPDWRQAGLARYASKALEFLAGSVAGSDHQLAWARAFASAAAGDDQLAVLTRLLADDYRLPGLTVDDELRWELLERLVAAGAAPDAAIEAELARDNTAAGARHRAACLAARPTAEAKAQAWASVVDSDQLTNDIQLAVIAGFAQPGQDELLAPYAEKYFTAVKAIFEQRPASMSEQIIVGLFPSLQACQATVDLADEWLSSANPPPALRRQILEGRSGVQRALQAQAADRAAAG
jgi:aminopeptidase N